MIAKPHTDIDKMVSGDSQKQALIKEINQQLDDRDARLTPIARKAARLAQLMGDIEHRILFDSHLDGFNPSGSSGSRIQPWPDKSVQPKWDVSKAFFQDRMEPKAMVALPLEQLELLVEQMRKAQESAPQEAQYALRVTLLEPELAHSQVLARIRNRVAIFVRLVEATVVDQDTRGGATWPMRQVGMGRVFIGHGRSRAWTEVKDFIEGRLGLQWDEFNRESTVGMSTKERLEELLAEACFALLIMTGDDEHADGPSTRGKT